MVLAVALRCILKEHYKQTLQDSISDSALTIATCAELLEMRAGRTTRSSQEQKLNAALWVKQWIVIFYAAKQ